MSDLQENAMERNSHFCGGVLIHPKFVLIVLFINLTSLRQHQVWRFEGRPP